MTRVFGFHYLSTLPILKPGDGSMLAEAARMAVTAGCQLFELVGSPINTMDAKETAEGLMTGGIYKASYCRFFPDGSEGSVPPFGNPIGGQKATQAAPNKLLEVGIL